MPTANIEYIKLREGFVAETANIEYITQREGFTPEISQSAKVPKCLENTKLGEGCRNISKCDLLPV